MKKIVFTCLSVIALCQMPASGQGTFINLNFESVNIYQVGYGLLGPVMAAIPEPSTSALLLFGLGGFLGWRKRLKKA